MEPVVEPSQVDRIRVNSKVLIRYKPDVEDHSIGLYNQVFQANETDYLSDEQVEALRARIPNEVTTEFTVTGINFRDPFLRVEEILLSTWNYI
jgi:hypothetical protein